MNIKHQFFLILLLFIGSCQQKDLFYKNAICIKGISTIDPIEGLKANQTIIIKEGKIFKIANDAEITLSSKNEIIDGTGKFLIPGLWDAHVHFAFIEDLAPRMFELFLAYGITSVRDTGGKIAFVKAWQQKAMDNPTDAPRVMIAGPLMDGMPNVYDGSDEGHPQLSVGLASPEAIAQQINELDSIGVDLVKAYEMLSPEQFILLCKLAKEKGLKVTGHVPLSMDVISASNAGLNSMEHMRNLEFACASNAEELLSQRRILLAQGKADAGGILRTRIHRAQRQSAIQNFDESKANEVLQALAKNKTWQIPTMALNTGSIEKPFTHPEWIAGLSHLPDTIEQQWKAGIEAVSQREVPAFEQEYTKWKFDMVSRIHKAGIDIMAGTDCPIFFLTPGRSLHQELAMLVKSGLTPLEALKTATLNPARYFNLEKELGSIKENMWADLLILDANPLENIDNTRQINTVIKQGKIYDRESLDAIFKRLSDN